MKKRLWIGTIGMGFLLIIMLAACSSTQLISSWAAPDVTPQHFNKVLVIGLMGAKDRNLRENAENAIVKDLQARGINAGSAFAEYGPKAFEGVKEEAALKRIKNKGYDGALTIALLDKRKEKKYNPGMVSVVPRTYRFWGYYRTVYTRLYQPGYYTVTNKFILEANLYNLDSGKLLYSAQTKSFDPSSPQSLAMEFSTKLLEDMMKKGVIK